MMIIKFISSINPKVASSYERNLFVENLFANMVPPCKLVVVGPQLENKDIIGLHSEMEIGEFNDDVEEEIVKLSVNIIKYIDEVKNSDNDEPIVAFISGEVENDKKVPFTIYGPTIEAKLDDELAKAMGYTEDDESASDDGFTSFQDIADHYQNGLKSRAYDEMINDLINGLKKEFDLHDEVIWDVKGNKKRKRKFKEKYTLAEILCAISDTISHHSDMLRDMSNLLVERDTHSSDECKMDERFEKFEAEIAELQKKIDSINTSLSKSNVVTSEQKRSKPGPKPGAKKARRSTKEELKPIELNDDVNRSIDAMFEPDLKLKDDHGTEAANLKDIDLEKESSYEMPKAEKMTEENHTPKSNKSDPWDEIRRKLSSTKKKENDE